MKALQKQREQEKEEFRELEGSFDELSARHTIIEERIGELTLGNANLHEEVANNQAEIKNLHAHVTFLKHYILPS